MKVNSERPIIGIVARASIENNICILTTVESYRRAIILSGGNPIVILPPQLVDYANFGSKDIPSMSKLEKEMLIEQISLCDGVLMPGGTRRYEYDRFITNYCLDQNIPILGICLGMQLLATHINRDTLEEVKSFINHSDPGNDRVHTIKLDKGSRLYEIIGEEEFYVNSRHRYNITEVGELSIAGYSNDGIIEAIEHENKTFAIGVQWHPENLMDTAPSKKLFKSFIKSCKK